MAKTRKRKSFTSIMVTCFMLVFAVTVCTSIYSEIKTFNELKEEEQRIIGQLDVELYNNIQLMNQQEYFTSDAYIEKVAREQLGFVMPDEVVFKNRELH